MMTNPKLSILCITYNHEKFIRQTLESFVTQKTDFDFEVIIGEDCSVDNTREIIREFEQKYPKIIKPIFRDKNIGGMQNFIDILYRAKGEYIALCEGDDYWTDPLKLKKQVDFLDANPDYVICCHAAKCINDDGAEWDWFNPPEIKDYYTLEDYISYGRTFIPTASLVTRNFISNLYEWFNDSPAGDMALIMSMCLQNNGKIKRFHEAMSVHRTHGGGIYSGMDYLEQQLFSIETRIYLRNKLPKEYDSAFKKGLRMILSQIISNVENVTKSNIELNTMNRELIQEINSLRQKPQKVSLRGSIIKYIRKVNDNFKNNP
jgi:glycosyltransferase involved in cell wall biosynthesis